MKKIITTICLSTILFSAIAQNISGTITESNDTPVEFINIVLLDLDGEMLTYSISDELGQFNLSRPVDVQSILRISGIGYEDVVDTIAVSSAYLNLNIVLEQSSYMMNEVTIKAKKPDIIRKGGKTIVSLENTVLAGETVSSLMRKVPGVISQRSGIKVGINPATILINGRSTRYMDMQSILQDFPVENILRIEILQQADASFEASGTGPIINLILKRNKLKGTKGAVSSSIGEDNGTEYSSSLYLYTYKNALNFEVVLGHSQYSYIENIDIFRNIAETKYTQLNADPNTPVRTSARTGLDWYVNDYHSVGVSMSAVTKDNLYTANNRITIDQQNRSERLFTYRDTESNIDFFSINPYYEWRWNPDTDEFAKINARYLNYRSIQNYDFRNTDVSTTTNYANQNIDQNGNTNAVNVSMDVKKYLDNDEKNTISFGYRYDRYNRDNDLKTFEENSENLFFPILNQTDNFIINEDIHAAYGQYSITLNKLDLTAGLRWEHSDTRGFSTALDSTNTQFISKLFPSASVSYKIGEQFAINSNYSYRIQRPNYSSLNPFSFNVDPLSRDSGNPRLFPEFAHNSSFSVLYNNQSAFQVTYINRSDNLFQAIFQNDETGEISRQYINIDKNESLAFQVGVPLFMIPGVQGGGAFIVNYQNIESDRAEFQYNNDKWSWMWSHQISFDLPWNIEFSNYFYYGTGQLEDVLELDWIANTGISLKRSFLENNALTATFSWDDIIQRKNVLTVADNSINGSIESYDTFGYWRIALRYKFGQKPLNKKQRKSLRDSGAERLK